MNPVYSIIHGFPCCQKNEEEQIKASTILGVTAIALGIIAMTIGVFIVTTPGFSFLSAETGWSLLGSSVALVAAGIAIKRIKKQTAVALPPQNIQEDQAPTPRAAELTNSLQELEREQQKIQERSIAELEAKKQRLIDQYRNNEINERIFQLSLASIEDSIETVQTLFART